MNSAFLLRHNLSPFESAVFCTANLDNPQIRGIAVCDRKGPISDKQRTESEFSFVNNTLVTKSVYISTLSTDKSQFLPDGVMPPQGPGIIMAISKLAGVITGPVNLSTTYTNTFADNANKLLGFTTG